MRPARHRRGIIIRFATLVALLATFGTSSAPAQDRDITVFAAASMQNALDDLNTAFTQRTGVKVIAAYAGSSALIKQIGQGAVADVFVSADLEWMDFGSKMKLIEDNSRIILLGNRLVLIAPKDAKFDSVEIGPNFDLAKLAGDGSIATGDVREVPVGKYAKAALELHVGADLGIGRVDDAERYVATCNQSERPTDVRRRPKFGCGGLPRSEFATDSHPPSSTR